MPAKRSVDPSIVLLPYLSADLGTQMGRDKDGPLIETLRFQTDEPLLDGPVSRRVAIIDLDPETGQVLPGVRFSSKGGARGQHTYAIAEPRNPESRDFMQVSVFATVLSTMAQFETADVLGRKLRWAFEGEQLLVVPRAGRMANAYYHRASRSLQFFFFDADINGVTKTIYTCLSPDIIAHETSHAILDGIAPDLYDSISPQALALHEAVADLSAVIFSLRSRELATGQLKMANGILSKALGFSAIAEQFGHAQSGEHDHPLRDLDNDHVLPGGTGTVILRAEPHALSTVLSGALYRLLVAIFDQSLIDLRDTQEPMPGREVPSQFSQSGKALFVAREKFKRIIFRGLDYLPPGEISFADYGRAMMAADASSNPDSPEFREILKSEFVRRGIVQTGDELEAQMPAFALPEDIDLDQLVRSNWAAYQFADRFRGALMVPPDIAIDVPSRLDVTKSTYRSDAEGKPHRVEFREYIFKVSWRRTQILKTRSGLVKELSIIHGSTLVIDWATREIKAFLTTSPEHALQKTGAANTNRKMRESYLAICLSEGMVQIGSPDAELTSGTLRLRGLGQFLHMPGH